MSARRPYALALAVAAAALAGCAAPPPPTAPGISAVLVQQRSDVAERQAQVRVRNDGAEPITIGGIQVADPRFDGIATRLVERMTTLDPGERVDVRVQLPGVDCAVPDEAIPMVTVEVEVEVEAEAAQREIAVEAGDPLDFLAALHARECLGERLAAVADVSIAEFRPAPAGAAATLVLAITPTGAGRARLDSVDSTTLLTYDPSGAAAPHPLGIDIAADSPALRVDVPLVPQRCDPHVVQEDKRGTIFTIDLAVEGRSGEVDFAAPPEMKAQILTWVARWCGFGASG